VDLKKRDFVWIGLVVVLICAGFVVATWDSSKAMFHDSEDVKITIGGTDYSLQNASDLGLIGGGMKFGTIVTTSSSGTALTDGFIIARRAGGGHGGASITGSVNGVIITSQATGYNDNPGIGITMPVKKGDAWLVGGSGQGSNLVWWISIE